MACFEHGTIVDLAARESLALPDVRGITLRVTRGTVWITQESDTQDIVLRAGDNWVVEKNGVTIVEAQEETTLCAIGHRLQAWQKPALVARRAPTAVWRRVGDAVAAFFATPSRRPAPYV